MTSFHLTRRFFLSSLAATSCSRSFSQPRSDIAEYRTPYKFGKLVLSASGESGAFDSKSVDCPFVFTHNNRFYMAYIGFDGIGYQTGLASSTDLVNWKREGCILRRNPESLVTRYNIAMNWILRENALHSPGHLKRVNGRFLGMYHAYPNAGYEAGPAVIGLCWSHDLHQWQIDAPCLKPEDGADWERGGLYKPCLLEEKGTYYCFYNAKTEGRSWREQTGVAVSKDLKQWTRYGGNPILPNGGANSWDQKFASDPCVLLDRGQWVLFYYGLDAKGKARDLLALGDNPFHFTKADEILVDVGSPGTVDSTFAHKPSIIDHDKALYHFYCAVSGKYPEEVRGISVTRSKLW